MGIESNFLSLYKIFVNNEIDIKLASVLIILSSIIATLDGIFALTIEV